MKKIVSLLLIVMVFLSSAGIPNVLAATIEYEFKESVSDLDEGYYFVAGSDAQAALGSVSKDNFIVVDNLVFKDLNGNGKLDVYEDWRANIEDRISDLYSQMTLEEKTRLLYHVCTCGNNAGVVYDQKTMYEQDCPFDVETSRTNYSMWYYINEYGITHYLDNSNGTPETQITVHNAIQGIGENSRLGIPITLSSDRQYNAWGGYIDTPKEAFGVANDPELAAALWESYSKETRAVGFHIVLQPFGVELGSFYGEDPEYISNMTAVEIPAIQAEGGMYACTKHFIARGGDSSFSAARSVAQTVDNWMVPWKTAIEADTKWIMTNGYNQGLDNTLNVDYCPETMGYLRNELGFDGVVLTDWGAMGNASSNIWDNMGGSDGITPDGIDLNSFSLAERYAWVINNGVDQMGAPGAGYEDEVFMAAMGPGLLSLEAIEKAVEDGLLSLERLEEAGRRILRTKFELGLFENPYSDLNEALALSASAEYIAEPWEIVNSESLAAARRPDIVALERKLQARSAVLVKNDSNLLPLDAGVKVYLAASSSSNAEAYAKYVGEKGVVVESMEKADVVVIDITRLDDFAEQAIEDAKDANKPLVVTANNIKPNAYLIDNADALLYLTFNRTADHGTAQQGFIVTTEPIVYSDLLFGVREPEGMIVKEITRSSEMDALQWKDLAGDQGASDTIRLILLALMTEDPAKAIPNNYGDPLLQYQYGMRYGKPGDFAYQVLVLPTVIEEREVHGMFGQISLQSMAVPAPAKTGEAYNVQFLLWNHGGSDLVNVEAVANGKVIGEKLMAVNGESWRVVSLDLLFDEPGEYDVAIGTLSASIVVE